MGRQVNEVTSVEKRNDSHAGGKNMVIQFLDLFMERGERLVRISALPQKDNSFHYIIIIKDSSICAMDGFSILSQANFWPLRDAGDVPDTQRRAAFSHD